MKKEELRIGNLVKTSKDDYFTEKGVTTVKSIDHDSINGYNDGRVNSKTELKYLSGIPITEGWLFKIEKIKESTFFNSFGYVKGWYIGEKEVCIVYFESKFYTYEMTDGENWGYVCNEIQFVHELQNYVYWHNNSKQELTFKTK